MSETAASIVEADLDHIGAALDSELALMGGKRLLIVGGAGFLGYYLVQSVLHWNGAAGRTNPVDVTVYDNYARGLPDWLAALKVGTAHNPAHWLASVSVCSSCASSASSRPAIPAWAPPSSVP